MPRRSDPIVTIRLDRKDLTTIDDAAREAGLSRSAYMVRAILGRPMPSKAR